MRSPALVIESYIQSAISTDSDLNTLLQLNLDYIN